MPPNSTVMQLFEAQHGDFERMYALGVEQRRHLAAGDVEALETCFAQVHGLMDRIRLRQERLADADATDPAVRQWRDRLRALVSGVQELRVANQRAAQGLLERARGELRGLGTRRRAARGYRTAPPGGARLYDGTR